MTLEPLTPEWDLAYKARDLLVKLGFENANDLIYWPDLRPSYMTSVSGSGGGAGGYIYICKNYTPIPPAIGKEEHRGILTGSNDPDGGSDYPEHAITSVIDDFEAIGKRLKEIQAEKDPWANLRPHHVPIKDIDK